MFVYQFLKWSQLNDERLKSGSENVGSSGDRSEVLPIDPAVKAQFESACAYLPSITERISEADLLYFYARFKQATLGDADPNERPGIFDIKGKRKFDKWLELRGLSKEKAMSEYTTKLSELDVGFEPNKKYSSGFGVRPSTMAASSGEEDENSSLSSSAIEWFSAVNRGDIREMARLLEKNAQLLEEKDENNLTALHLASDRGNTDVVGFLLKEGANKNAQDYEGQTPLHYAVSCSHRETVEALLNATADPTVADFEGNCALDIATDPLIKTLLERKIP